MTRNEEICQLYASGVSLTVCIERYKLSRERLRQILRKAGIWRGKEPATRDAFLGVNLSEESKAALKVKAEAEGVSMSRLVSDAVDEMVK